jgi:hypothetical protein
LAQLSALGRGLQQYRDKTRVVLKIEMHRRSQRPSKECQYVCVTG